MKISACFCRQTGTLTGVSQLSPNSADINNSGLNSTMPQQSGVPRPTLTVHPYNMETRQTNVSTNINRPIFYFTLAGIAIVRT